jgi:hypothetical protein
MHISPGVMRLPNLEPEVRKGIVDPTESEFSAQRISEKTGASKHEVAVAMLGPFWQYFDASVTYSC